jgi:hypothetical protein
MFAYLDCINVIDKGSIMSSRAQGHTKEQVAKDSHGDSNEG